MRRGVIALAIGSTGLMTAIAVAEIGGGSLTPERALARTIAQQRVAAGEPATTTPAAAPATTAPPAAGAPSGGPPAADPREAILAEVDRIEAEMNRTVTRLEDLKKSAYEAHDIIRMNFVSGKLDEIKTVKSQVQPVFDAIRQPGLGIFEMQAKLGILRDAVGQMRHAAAQAESAAGDDMDVSSVGSLNVAPGGTNTGENDPSNLPLPTSDNTTAIDRPGEASPFQ